MEKIVFVALSHTLTQEQVDSLNADKIVLLADVNADLAAQCRNIDPTWGINQVQQVAASVVAEAVNVGATHFVCQGEPALAMWANLIASGNFEWVELTEQAYEIMFDEVGIYRKMTCIQSTTKRELISEVHEGNGEVTKRTVFKHVQWRELFQECYKGLSSCAEQLVIL